MVRVIDTHAHLDEIEDLEQALTDADAVGVFGIVAVGSDHITNLKILSIADLYPGFVYPAVGLHPWYIKSDTAESELDSIRIQSEQAIAIGEIGLDYHKKVVAAADKDLQKAVLTKLLKIAHDSHKVAIIHSRYAWKDSLNLVKDAGVEKAVFHWYTGPSSILRDIIASGYYLSVTPAIEYHEEHRRAIKETPLDKLLLETDSPVVYRKGAKEEYTSRPSDVLRSLVGVARLKDMPENIIAEATTENAVRLFELQARLY